MSEAQGKRKVRLGKKVEFATVSVSLVIVAITILITFGPIVEREFSGDERIKITKSFVSCTVESEVSDGWQHIDGWHVKDGWHFKDDWFAYSIPAISYNESPCQARDEYEHLEQAPTPKPTLTVTFTWRSINTGTTFYSNSGADMASARMAKGLYEWNITSIDEDTEPWS